MFESWSGYQNQTATVGRCLVLVVRPTDENIRSTKRQDSRFGPRSDPSKARARAMEGPSQSWSGYQNQTATVGRCLVLVVRPTDENIRSTKRQDSRFGPRSDPSKARARAMEGPSQSWSGYQNQTATVGRCLVLVVRPTDENIRSTKRQDSRFGPRSDPSKARARAMEGPSQSWSGYQNQTATVGRCLVLVVRPTDENIRSTKRQDSRFGPRSDPSKARARAMEGPSQSWSGYQNQTATVGRCLVLVVRPTDENIRSPHLGRTVLLC